jgi:biopolymer transport protein ExbB/TolQ
MDWFNRLSRIVMRSSLGWGVLATVGFYIAIRSQESALNPFILRCLTGRWEAYVCMAMFFIGIASLVIKAVEIVQQTLLLRRTIFTPVAAVGQTSATVRALVKQLDAQPGYTQQSYLVRRFRDTLEFVLRRGSNESLDEHLRYLADIDTAKMNTSYGLSRFLSWAIPAVGSLGTVLGIAEAVSHLAAPATAEPFAGVTAGLALAFDTMALSLALSILLVFCKFACEQQEGQLLMSVEQRVEHEVSEHVGGMVPTANSQFNELRKLTESVVEATEKLAQRQAGLWQDSLEQTNTRWNEQSNVISEQLEAIVARAVASATGGAPIMSGGGGGMVSSEGQIATLSQVQESLQQVADFFSRKNSAELQESEVFRQLAEMVNENAKSLSKGPSQPRRPKASDDSAVGLWNSLAD